MIATDAITAILLFTQFAILRSSALLVMAIGYAYAALILIPYLLTFPELFGPARVIGGPLGTAWFFILWRTGFSVFVIGYALLKDAKAYSRGTVGSIVGIGVGVAAGLVVAAIALDVSSGSFLPAAFFATLGSTTLYPYYVGGPVLAMNSLAIMVLWFRRGSLLDLLAARGPVPVRDGSATELLAKSHTLQHHLVYLPWRRHRRQQSDSGCSALRDHDPVHPDCSAPSTPSVASAKRAC